MSSTVRRVYPTPPAAQKACVEKNEMIRALHEEDEYSDPFIAYALARNIRVESNKFRKLGSISYNGEVDANDSRLSIVRHD